MPATSTFHIIEGSLAEETPQQARIIVNGMIDNLQVDSDPDPEVIVRAITACKSAGYIIGNAVPGMTTTTTAVLQRILVRGYSNNSCHAQLFYESPTIGGPASALIVRRRSYLAPHAQNTIQLEDGTRLILAIPAYTDPDTGEVIKGDMANITFLRAMRSISVSGLVYGTAPPVDDDYIGYVNSGTFKGKPTGYWLMSEYETDISRYSGYYTFSCTALTKNTEPWSEYQSLYNTRTHKWLIPPTVGMNALTSAPYAQGATTTGGAIRVDPYPTVNFTPIFGSSAP
jgi:hypothetical protein